ncbi:2TM domain-containing protein [Tenacibaculum sp. 190130A14a]|uniref:2TM domain-containing protein n=2 Tax=Tenacibaculum polynesiense TaxID=3137857 RepID=A0ABM9P738_9FLAO
MENLSEEYRYARAKKRVEKIKGLYIHLIVTILVIPFLIFINLKFVPHFHWFYYAGGGMLIGLFFHWFGIYGLERMGLGKDWEQKKINEYLKERE